MPEPFRYIPGANERMQGALARHRPESDVTYWAFCESTGEVFYQGEPHGTRLFGLLPKGTEVLRFPGSEADEWEGAQFRGPDGEVYAVRRDAVEGSPDA